LTIFPSSGGAISGLDFKPRFANLLDTLARRPERYHREIRKLVNKTIVPDQKKTTSIHDSPQLKSKGLEKLLIYDKHPKYAFVDYFLKREDNFRSFERQDFQELANFPDVRYEAEIQKSNLEVAVSLSCSCVNPKGDNMTLRKIIHVPADSSVLKVDYQIDMIGSSGGTISGLFVPEINLGSLSDEGFTRRYGRTVFSSSDRIEISYEDTGIQVSINLEGENSSRIIPVKTVSLSEKGFESNLQGISVLPIYLVDLDDNNESFKTSIELQMRTS